MKREELKEIMLDVFTEYMPKVVKKDVRGEIADELINELEDQGLVDLEEEEVERTEDSDEIDSLFERQLTGD